jgi:hypothetical protein
MRFLRLQALRTSLRKRRKLVVPVAIATLAAILFSVAAPSNAAPTLNGTIALVPGTDYSCAATSPAWGSSAANACDADYASEPPATRWIAAGTGEAVKVTFSDPTYLAGIGFRGWGDDNNSGVVNRRVTGGTLVGCDDSAFTNCSSNLTTSTWDNIGSGVSFGEYGVNSFTPPAKAYKYYKFTVTRLYGDTVGAANNQYNCPPDNGGNGKCMQLGTIFFFKKNFVSFDKNGGTGTAMSDQISISAANLSSNTFAAPTGKAFSGWNTKADGSGTWYADGASYPFNTSSDTLYAQWMGLTSSNQTAIQGSTFTAYTPTITGTIPLGGTWSTSSLANTGLSINSATGEITGSPTVNGTKSVTVTYTNAYGASTSTTFDIAITARYSVKYFSEAGTEITSKASTYVDGSSFTPDSGTADTLDAGGQTTSKFAGWSTAATGSPVFYSATTIAPASGTGNIILYERRVNAPSARISVTVSGRSAVTITGNNTFDFTSGQSVSFESLATADTGGTLDFNWQRGVLSGPQNMVSGPLGSTTSTATYSPSNSDRIYAEITSTLNGVSITGASAQAIFNGSPTLTITTPVDARGEYAVAGTQVTGNRASGGKAPYTYSMMPGGNPLPSWASIDPTTGAISGTPNTLLNRVTGFLYIRVTDANGMTADTTVFTLTVDLTSRTISFSQTAYTKPYGSTQTVVATQSQGRGPIEYSAGSSTACTVDSSTGVVTITQSSGTCSISATIAGYESYAEATTTTPVTITVTKATPVVSVSTSDVTATYGDSAITFSNPTVTPSSGTWTFAPVGSSGVVSVSGNTLSFNTAGPNCAWNFHANKHRLLNGHF